MDDKLVTRANTLKAAVDSGKESFIAVKSEYEVNKKLLDETLAEIKEKFGVSSYEELQTSLKALGEKISADLDKIAELLAEANIPVPEVDE